MYCYFCGKLLRYDFEKEVGVCEECLNADIKKDPGQGSLSQTIEIINETS